VTRKNLAKSTYMLYDGIYCIAAALMRNIQMCAWAGSVEIKGTQHSDKSQGPGKFCSEAEKRIYIAIYRDMSI